VGGGVEIVHDRAILRELLALAPPGIDELYAVASLGDALDDDRYARIIVDPAPTGHLLRLLELPSVAIEWSHRLMRLIMKYKDLAGLGDAAQDLVNFSRRTRALDRLLHDETRAGVVLVSLEEPAVIAETRRLGAALQATGVAIVGVVRNRAVNVRAPADWYGTRTWPTFVAPVYGRPLVGITAIRDWCEHWQERD
jgi:arsenite-transporting ATPase